jgi:cation diffusion facilitator family transporter
MSHQHGHEHPHHAHEDHANGHEESHGQDDSHSHDSHAHSGRLGWLTSLLPFGHGHTHGAVDVDTALESSARGIRTLQLSLVIMLSTAAVQMIITVLSGSTALLTDTLHNFSDGLTALPLWVAFVFGRRPASRRYTYGYARGEDLAGVVIVMIIILSAAFAGYESARRIINPVEINHLGWVMAAAVVGFLGNEAVAIYRIRTGKAIGSAALVADGQHARADGLTSLAVLGGALGVLAGAKIADPIAGLLITGIILMVVKDAALTMWHRLMDAVDPAIVDEIEEHALIPGVLEVDSVRVRWLGHRLESEMHIDVDGEFSTRESHRLAEEVRHILFHEIPQLAVVTVHVDPGGDGHDHAHELTAHHEPGRPLHAH